MTGAAESIDVAQDDLQTVKLGPHFEINATGLGIHGRPSFDAFEALGETLRTLDRSLQFAVGDFFREVEERFPQKASQLLDHTSWSESTLRVYRNTAKSVAPERRRMDVLTYSHHQVVAALPPRDQKRWLDRAAEGEERQGVQQPWAVSKLKQAIKTGTEPVVTAWRIIVTCDSEQKRDAVMKDLESRGLQCRAIESHGKA